MAGNTIVIKDQLMKKTIKLLDLKLVQAKFANREFEGEIKKAGDTVTVQTFPNLVINEGTVAALAGEDIASQTFVITAENLTVDKVANANYQIKDIEVLRSNLDLQAKVAERLAYQLAVKYDTFVSTIAIAAATAIGTPIAWTKANVYGELERMSVALDTNLAPDEGRKLFVLPAYASIIRQAPEFDGTREGLDVRVKGYIGQMSGFEIFKTTNLPAKTTYAMVENAVNFVEQFNKMKITEATNAFRFNMLLETYYGGKVFTENAKMIVKYIQP